MLLKKLQETYTSLVKQPPSEERKIILEPLVDYLMSEISNNRTPVLNFICTHNSRRSQFAQMHAQAAAGYYQIPVQCFSGGVEETALHMNAVNALRKAGFEIPDANGTNPRYSVKFSNNSPAIVGFSKLFDAHQNKAERFAAVMTCSHADDNCPHIPGAKARIALNYQDPKQYDNTAKSEEKYEERSLQIASEMLYLFHRVKLKQ